MCSLSHYLQVYLWEAKAPHRLPSAVSVTDSRTSTAENSALAGKDTISQPGFQSEKAISKKGSYTDQTSHFSPIFSFNEQK